MSLALTMSVLVSIVSSTESIKLNMFAATMKEYGKYSGAITDVANAKSLPLTLSRGLYKTTKPMLLKDREVIAGTIDNEFVLLSNISLTEGGLPEDIGEVAIESYYLRTLYPNWKVGQSESIQLQDAKKTLKLVGIIENYSSRLYSGITAFPNIVLSTKEPDIDMSSNYLVGYDISRSAHKNIDMMTELVSQEGNEGFLNERLFNKGILEAEKLQDISFAIQLSILIASAITILTMFSFYYYNNQKKFSIFKTVGATSIHLGKISVIQTSILFIVSVIISIPVIIAFHIFIIHRTYRMSLFNKEILTESIPSVLFWAAIVYVIAIASMLVSIVKSKGKVGSAVNKSNIDDRGIGLSKIALQYISSVKRFESKQLILQLGLFPKQIVLLVLALTCSILIVLVSVVFAKETAGIWNTDIDYFLTSQENMVSQSIEGHKVLVSDERFFSSRDVDRVESLSGIKLIVKEPFMYDVSIAMKKGKLARIQENFSKIGDMPDVRYVLMQKKDMISYFRISEAEAADSIVIYLPDLLTETAGEWVDSTVTLSKIKLNDRGEYEKRQWDYRVADVVDSKFKEIFNYIDSGTNQPVVILNEESAIQKGVTPGYKDLTVYTNDSISAEQQNRIYDQVYGLTLGVPGSLFQYIPDLKRENNRLPGFISFLGSLVFYASMFFSTLSLYVVLLVKYQLQRRYWGIYRSLGMRSGQVFKLLFGEAFIYLLLAALLSSAIYYLFLLLVSHSYPMLTYIYILITTLISAFSIVALVLLSLYKKVKGDSIAQLLRVTG